MLHVTNPVSHNTVYKYGFLDYFFIHPGTNMRGVICSQVLAVHIPPSK